MSRDRPSVHIDPLMIEAYAAQLVDAGSAVTIEQHLTWCERCRACVAAAGIRGELPGVSPGRLEGIWTAVVEAIDAPPASVPHRIRHYLPLAWNRLRHLLADFEIPKMRMIPRARRTIVTVIAAITISTLVNVSGSGSFLAGHLDDSVDGDGTGRHAHTASNAFSQHCAPADVSFALTWLLQFSWVISVGDGVGTVLLQHGGGDRIGLTPARSSPVARAHSLPWTSATCVAPGMPSPDE